MGKSRSNHPDTPFAKEKTVQLSRRLVKIGIIIPVAIALALISGAHALSAVLTRSSPELAIAIFPGNGLAHQQIAYRAFTKDVKRASLAPTSGSDSQSLSGAMDQASIDIGQDQVRAFAVAASPSALVALRYEPLLPRAHAILAISEAEPKAKKQIIELASRLNRRNSTLQGLVLQEKLAALDYAGMIETLDQILRVRPERGSDIFPVLVEALEQDATVAPFTQLFAKPLPWRDQFLNYAVKQPDVLKNLAAVREGIAIENPDFDKRLIANLAKQGDIAIAQRIYKLAGQGDLSTSRQKNPNWASDYAPFDWALADDGRFRAQQSTSRYQLEFTIDPGYGGILASRLMPMPQKAFTVNIANEVQPNASRKDVKLVLSCWGETAPFFEEAFQDAKGAFVVKAAPSCPYLQLAITGRSWTGSRPVSGTFKSVVVVE